MSENFEKALASRVAGGYPQPLFDAMRYSLFNGGKRLRPRLLLSACADLGGDENEAMPFACAMEMIHTYSLIHDDLPAMDNDDFRRGQPTCHKKFGEAVAILAGDGLLNLAFETMAEACENSSVEAAGRRFAAAGIIAKAAGARGMVGGQAADIDSDAARADGAVLTFIHEKKTAALFSAALAAGSALAGAAGEKRAAMAEAGKCLGLAFQIKDDICDAAAEKDAGKASYAVFYGLEKAEEDYMRHSQEAIRLIARECPPDGALHSLAVSMSGL